MEHEDKFYVVFNAVVSEEQTADFVQGLVWPQMSGQIFVWYPMNLTQFQVEEAKTKMVLETSKSQHKEVDSHLLVTLHALIEHVLNKVVNLLMTIGNIL